MRYTIIPRMHLSRLAPGMKVLLTLFLLSVGLGLWTSALKYTCRAEFSPTGAERYFRGDPDDAELDALDPPTLDGELTIHEPKTAAYLIDVIHPHAFTVPVLLFILYHFLALTRLRERHKIALHLYGFGSFFLAFGSPWLVLWDGRLAWLFVAAGTNLLASFAVVMAILLYETWCARVPIP